MKTRSYKKNARAKAEKGTGEAILNAALNAFSKELFDRVTLDQIARDSGVTVQTVIRRFGSKEELFEKLAEREEKRVVSEREVSAEKGLNYAIQALVNHYEKDGDMMSNLINQEKISEPIRKIVNRGRQLHRKWVEKHCHNLLDGLESDEYEKQLYSAITATDLGTWKLLRRDYGLHPEFVASIMIKLLNSLNGDK